MGLVVFYDEKDVRLHRCSGTLLSPTIFLTAGHCTDKTATARVWFGAEPAVEGFPDFGGVAGTPITHPEFNDAGFPNRRDVGVVVLDPPIPVEVVSVYGSLPQLGVLDDLATQRGPEYPTFTVVGYGFQALKPEAQTDVVRYRGSTKLVTLRSFITDGFNIRMSSNPGQASGGICAGDSGGPALLDDSNIVVAINSFILDSHCWVQAMPTGPTSPTPWTSSPHSCADGPSACSTIPIGTAHRRFSGSAARRWSSRLVVIKGSSR